MKVYFLRHGESEYNVKRLINANSKNRVPLTKKGSAQVREVAKKLSSEKFDVIFSSEFLRARQTAEIVNKELNVKIILDKRLNEIDVGLEDGRPAEEFFEASVNDIFNFKLKGGESWQDLKKRVGDFLKDLKKKKYGVVLVVSHQWVLAVMNEIVKSLTDEEAYEAKLGVGEFIKVNV